MQRKPKFLGEEKRKEITAKAGLHPPKLTEADVLQIRTMAIQNARLTNVDIGTMFGVTKSTIQKILARTTYRRLDTRCRPIKRVFSAEAIENRRERVKVTKLRNLEKAKLKQKEKRTQTMLINREARKEAYRICKGCGIKKFIVGWAVCRACYEERYKERAPKKHESKRKAVRIKQRKITGEKQLFKTIWEENDDEHYCHECGIGLFEFNVSYFHHIRPKSTHPHLRLDPVNIEIVCTSCHQKYHS